MTRLTMTMLAAAALLLASPAWAGETIEADGHTWKVRDTNLGWHKDVADPAANLKTAVIVSVTDARTIGWPDGTIGATVTRGSWGIVTDRSVFFVEDGLERAFEAYVAAIGRSQGLDASSSRFDVPGGPHARIEVELQEFWLTEGAGPLHPTVTTLKMKLKFYAPGTDQPGLVLTVDRPTAVAPRFGKSGWEQAMEAAVPQLEGAMQNMDAQATLRRPAPEGAATPVAAGPSAGDAPTPAADRPTSFHAVWVQRADGTPLVGTMLAVAEDGVCIDTAAGELLLARSEVSASETFELPVGAGTHPGALLGVATAEDGSRFAGAVVATDPWTLAGATELKSYPDGSAILTGPISFTARPGGLCANYGE